MISKPANNTPNSSIENKIRNINQISKSPVCNTMFVDTCFCVSLQHGKHACKELTGSNLFGYFDIFLFSETTALVVGRFKSDQTAITLGQSSSYDLREQDGRSYSKFKREFRSIPDTGAGATTIRARNTYLYL